MSSLRSFGMLLTAVLVTAIVYFPTTLSLLRMWNAFGSRFYTHGDLIALLAAHALIRRKPALEQVQLKPSPIATAALLPLTLVWLFAYLSTIQVAHQACLPLILWVAIFAVFGAGTARICRFPIGFLYFGIPIWEWARPPLQALTIATMGIALPSAGIPTHIVGDLVEVPAGTFEIQGGCAGEMYLIVALALAAFHGDMHAATPRHRVLLLALAAATAVLANWTRVFLIIVAGQLTHMQSYLVRVSHDGFGWCIFAIAMVIFIVAANRLTGRSQSAARTAVFYPLQAAAIRRAWIAATALAFLAAGPAWAAIATHRNLLPLSLSNFQRRAAGWTGPLPYRGSWQPVFSGATVRGLATYGSDDGAVDLYVAAYASQSDAAKLHSHANSLFDESANRLESESRIHVAGGDVLQLQLLDAEEHRWLLWSVYAVGRHRTPSVLMAQLWYAVEAMRSAPSSRVVELRTACLPTCTEASARLSRFTDDNQWVLAGER